MATPDSGFSVHVTITIAPENVPKFFEAFRPVFDIVSAEPECTYFEVFQDPKEPGVISWVENWCWVLFSSQST
jgi:quinol monooxygenase YgiN